MTKVKTVEFTFYSITTPEKEGLKLVLWEIVDDKNIPIYDWGFAYWSGSEWDSIGIPDGFTATVKWWAETLHSDVLLKEKSKIISLNGS